MAFNLWQAGNIVALQAAVQQRSPQMGDRRLQGIKTVVERQQRVSAEGNDDCLLLKRPDRRSGRLRSDRQINDGIALSPLCHGLRIDPVALGELSQALLTILYRPVNCLGRGGADVTNVAHNTSFHSRDEDAPSKLGTNHIVPNNQQNQ